MLWFRIAEASTFAPPAATEVAERWDSLYSFLLWASLISFIIVVGGMTYFILKYRRKTNADKTAYITHNVTLEFLWSFLPFVLFMVVAAWGLWIYLDSRQMPEEGLEIRAIAKKWEWQFDYKNGRKVTNTMGANNEPVPATMVVPENTPIKVILTSTEDLNPEGKYATTPVLHSFFIPAFRIKQDVVPGRYVAVTFEAKQRGEFWLFCAEYCGTNHSRMLGKIRVVSKEDFETWLTQEDAGLADMSPAALGRDTYLKMGCAGCHSLDGTITLGPSWKGLWGSNRKFADGSTAVADENYIRESILAPNEHVVEGFPAGQMPVYKGMLSDEQIDHIIEFIKSL
jgi:cytochrome c oxidase subunit 2